MNLSPVSRTAILLLICRAVESEMHASEFSDPMSVLCLNRLLSLASKDEQGWISSKKRMYEGLHERDARAGVRRGKVFDHTANRYIADHPGCTVINLACGFDTRFWRIEHENCNYIELDLPEVLTLKKDLMKDHLRYELIGSSVLDTAWMDRVTLNGNSNFLLLAEGLFMWLPEQDATKLIQAIALRFDRSQLVLDMVREKYTHGIWKILFRLHSKIEWGLDVVWLSGIKHPDDLENCATGLKVIGVANGSAGPILTVSINHHSVLKPI